jgi:two-component system, cell cycle sensor histidine kinase and response regulator CckA
MDSSEPLRILIVDDNPAIHKDFAKIFTPPNESVLALDAAEAALFGQELHTPNRAQRLAFELSHAHQGIEALGMVQQALAEGRPYSLAFVDMRMPPGWDGVQTLKAIWESDPTLQAVICTAYSDYSWDQMCEHFGTTDNFLILKKPFDIAEVQQMASALTRKWALNKQAQMKLCEMEHMVLERTEALRQSHEQFSITFHSAPLPQALFRYRDGICLDANAAFCNMTGHSLEDWRQNPVCLLNETQLIYAAQGPHPLQALELDILGCATDIKAHVHTQMVQFGAEPCLLLMAQDISERARLEDQLRHAQKMEAVGQLAAGIAHDFNNILTVIQGNLSLLSGATELERQQTPTAPLDPEALSQTLDAAQRAAALTRQLLTFSRKQVFQPVALDMNDLIHRQSQLLGRLLGEHVTIHTHLSPDLPFAHGDAMSIEQAVVNLSINARDAMPQGGQLLLGTHVVRVEAEHIPMQSEATPGEYICITVADSGQGMDEATQRRIFEPFFTTKGVGKGTGMGLAMVYATVLQHKGWINVKSQLSKGTSFAIYLPVSYASLPENPLTTAPLTALEKTVEPMRILLVEDDPAVRRVMQQMLLRAGCSVLESNNAEDGYQKWSSYRQYIDLVITDIVMPGGQTGEDLARRIFLEKPDMHVIYCSGYSPSLFENGNSLIKPENFLAKPYDTEKVTNLLRQVSTTRRIATGQLQAAAAAAAASLAHA